MTNGSDSRGTLGGGGLLRLGTDPASPASEGKWWWTTTREHGGSCNIVVQVLVRISSIFVDRNCTCFRGSNLYSTMPANVIFPYLLSLSFIHCMVLVI